MNDLDRMVCAALNVGRDNFVPEARPHLDKAIRLYEEMKRCEGRLRQCWERQAELLRLKDAFAEELTEEIREATRIDKETRWTLQSASRRSARHSSKCTCDAESSGGAGTSATK